MEHQKILNLLNNANDSKFLTRNWIVVNDQSNASYSVGNEIIYSTEVLKFHLCSFSNASILPKLAVKESLSLLDKVLRKISGKGVLIARKEFSLFPLNDDMDDIVRILKSLEDSAVLIGVNQLVIRETKKEEDNFLGVVLAPLTASLVGPVISSVVTGVSEIRIMSVERGNNKISKSSPSLNE